MPALPRPKGEIDKLEKASQLVDSYIAGRRRVPKSLKNDFGLIWGKPYEVGDSYIKLATSKEGGSNSIYVEDAVLLKSAFAVPLYDLYSSYMDQLKRIEDSGGVSETEKEKFGEKKAIAADLIERVKAAVQQLADLDAESAANLVQFLTAGKADRIENFGNYKGLSRSDPFQPAAARALGLRVDYYGFINDVISTFRNHREVQARFVELVSRVNETVQMPIAEVLGNDFNQALEDCGFYNGEN